MTTVVGLSSVSQAANSSSLGGRTLFIEATWGVYDNHGEFSWSSSYPNPAPQGRWRKKGTAWCNTFTPLWRDSDAWIRRLRTTIRPYIYYNIYILDIYIYTYSHNTTYIYIFIYKYLHIKMVRSLKTALLGVIIYRVHRCHREMRPTRISVPSVYENRVWLFEWEKLCGYLNGKSGDWPMD